MSRKSFVGSPKPGLGFLLPGMASTSPRGYGGCRSAKDMFFLPKIEELEPREVTNLLLALGSDYLGEEAFGRMIETPPPQSPTSQASFLTLVPTVGLNAAPGFFSPEGNPNNARLSADRAVQDDSPPPPDAGKASNASKLLPSVDSDFGNADNDPLQSPFSGATSPAQRIPHPTAMPGGHDASELPSNSLAEPPGQWGANPITSFPPIPRLGGPDLRASGAGFSPNATDPPDWQFLSLGIFSTAATRAKGLPPHDVGHRPGAQPSKTLLKPGSSVSTQATGHAVGAFAGDPAPPTLSDQVYGVHAGVDLDVSAPGVLLNSSDNSSDVPSLTAVVVDGPSSGALTLNPDGSFVYSPGNSDGTDSFTYAAIDAVGEESNPATVTLDVHTANNLPSPTDDSYSIAHNQTLTVSADQGVLANDSDPELDPLTANLIAGASHGSVSLEPDGSISYTPIGGYVGPDSFTYEANDGLVNSSPATVQIDVTNTTPAVADTTYSVARGGTLRVGAQNGLLQAARDFDGDRLTLSIVNRPTMGSLVSWGGDGSFTYQSDNCCAGLDSFTYKVNDGRADSPLATATIEVLDPPFFAGHIYFNVFTNTADNGSYNGYALSSTPGSRFTSRIVDPPQNGSATVDGASLSYTPDPDYTGPDSFTFAYNDGVHDSNLGTATVNVLPAGSPTSVANDVEFYTLMDQTLSVPAPGPVAANFAPNLSGLYRMFVAAPPQNGQLIDFPTDGSRGDFVYQPNDGFSGDDSFTYFDHDGFTGRDSNIATVHIKVVDLNLQMTGVARNQKLNPGGYVLVNGNNDNGSPVKKHIPLVRDFETAKGSNRDDPQLVAIQTNAPQLPPAGALALNYGLNDGFLPGYGAIKLWDSARKNASGGKLVLPNVFYTQNRPIPPTVYVEGVSYGAFMQENYVSLTLFYLNFAQGFIGVGSDKLNITVTPLVNQFTLTPGRVRFGNAPNINTLAQGLTTAALPGSGGPPGVLFEAEAFVPNPQGGQLEFLQNMDDAINGVAGGGGAGFTFRPGLGRDYNLVLKNNRDFPILDRTSASGAPPIPFYDGRYRIRVNGNLQDISAEDSPATGVPAVSNTGDLNKIDLSYNFSMYLVWKYPDVDNIFFPLYVRQWNVVFYGYYSAPNYRIDPYSRVYTIVDGQRNPPNPGATEVPIFNKYNVIT